MSEVETSCPPPPYSGTGWKIEIINRKTQRTITAVTFRLRLDDAFRIGGCRIDYGTTGTEWCAIFTRRR